MNASRHNVSEHPPMSESGQTRTSADVYDTTASPPVADMTGSLGDVADGPLPDIQPPARAAPQLHDPLLPCLGQRPFASGLATARAYSIKSCASALSVRLLSVKIRICRCVVGSSTDSFLSAPCLAGNF